MGLDSYLNEPSGLISKKKELTLINRKYNGFIKYTDKYC